MYTCTHSCAVQPLLLLHFIFTLLQLFFSRLYVRMGEVTLMEMYKNGKASKRKKIHL